MNKYNVKMNMNLERALFGACSFGVFFTPSVFVSRMAPSTISYPQAQTRVGSISNFLRLFTLKHKFNR